LLLLSSLLAFAPRSAAQAVPPSPTPRRLETTSSFSLPFKLIGGLVVLSQLTVNGQRGDFILDTGSAEGLVVDSHAFAGQLRAGPHNAGYGGTGTVRLQYVTVTGFALGPARYTGLLAPAFSLAHLRAYLGPQAHLLGFIGYGLLRDYEVVLDYPHRRVTCYSLRTPIPVRRPWVRADSLAFTLTQGRPLATGYIDQVPVRLLLDTGAVTNDLDAAFCQQLPAAAQPVLTGTDPITGSDGHRQVARVGQLPRLVLGTTLWQQTPVKVFAYAPRPDGRPVAYQGILGHPFLLQLQVVSFHYGRQQLYSLVPRPVPAPRRGGR